MNNAICFTLLLLAFGCGTTPKNQILDKPGVYKMISATTNDGKKDSVAAQPKQKIQINYFCKSESFTMDSIIVIAVNPKKYIPDANEILNAKELMWTGIQKNDSVLLDFLFSKNFVNLREGQFRERKEHIIAMTKKNWTLLNVRAWNICLEFISDIAILTYQNTGTVSGFDNSVNEFTYAGVDVWIQEMGKWKISTHRPL